MENRAFKLAGIKTLITKNYGLPATILDLEALVDDSLLMSENWGELKNTVLGLCSWEKFYSSWIANGRVK